MTAREADRLVTTGLYAAEAVLVVVSLAAIFLEVCSR